jgi:predicted O-methyltransferase YrrM
MHGIDGIEIDHQIAELTRHVSPEIAAGVNAKPIHEEACRENGEPGYGTIEADVLYAFVRAQKPARIVQIGCGVSTSICLMAAADQSYKPDILCVEPYPTTFLQTAERHGRIRLLRQFVQDADPAIVNSLQSGDFLFIDSTHTLGPAGEVTRIVLELLPRLGTGVHVHFHDIGFPYDYGRGVLTRDLFFQHESALLHAFLTFNHRFRLSFSLSMLHYSRPETLQKLFSRYVPAGNDEGLESSAGHFPSSVFLRVIDERTRS